MSKRNIVFITGTGTSVGKTFISTALTRALVERGVDVVSVKPIETGCEPDAIDAMALADASGRAELVDVDGFYRDPLPRAPYSISLETGRPGPNLRAIEAAIRALAAQHELVIVEGAGGLLVPLTATDSFADCGARMTARFILVAGDYLGTISHTLSCVDAMKLRGLKLAAVVVNQSAQAEAIESNATVLQNLITAPVILTRTGFVPDPAMQALVSATWP